MDAVIRDECIVPDDIWNMDETGFRIGVGKNQIVITKRKRAHFFSIPENRESCTAIEAVSFAGNYIPAFLILAGQLHMSHWYQQPELHDDTRIIPNSSGFSITRLALNGLSISMSTLLSQLKE